jgi:hypothetical protein
MVDFKKLLADKAKEASMLPSFPQKNATYNISVSNPDMQPREDWTEQENSFGKMVKRKQTVFHINTKEGIIRISPNQMMQLNDLLADIEVPTNAQYVTVNTADSEHGLVFVLPE